MWIFGVKLCVVRVRFFYDCNDTYYSWWFGVRMIEESLLTNLHLPHEVSGLIVPHPVPTCGRVFLLSQVLETELEIHTSLEPGLRLRFDQPVGHRRQHRTLVRRHVDGVLVPFPFPRL